MEVAFPVSQVKEWMGDVRAISTKTAAAFLSWNLSPLYEGIRHWMGLNHGEDVLALRFTYRR